MKATNYRRFTVHMLARHKKGTKRVVSVPRFKIDQAANTKHILKLIFKYGQDRNHEECVSVGDVIEYNKKYYEVTMANIREIPFYKFKNLQGERAKRGDIF